MRRIVFASGKGGTGKTTLSSLTARLATRDGLSLVLADCDVEAANLPIALSAEVTDSTPFAGGAKAVVRADVCQGCGACALACRFGALVPSRGRSGAHAYRVDPLTCEGCGACVRECPYGIIEMRPTNAGEVFTARTAVGPMAFGRLKPGEDLSGKLVTEVRATADRLGSGDGPGYQWIDGPPGTGCPAIAAMTGTDLVVAVTEPTISGEHDLMRLVTLARRFSLPVAVVLNKADLSAAGASRLKERISAEGLGIVAEIPYDPALIEAGERAVPGEGALTPGFVAVIEMWERLRLLVG